MADQTTDTPQMTHEEAIKIIFLAKHTASVKTFTLFQKNLADEKIPWSFSDPRFLEKVQKLKNDLATELKLQNEKLVDQVAEESFSRSLSEEEREGITKGFEKIQKQEQTHREDLFKHTESLVDSYVKHLKEQGALLPDQESNVRTSISQAAQKAASRGEFSDITRQMALATGDQVSAEAASSAASSITIAPDAQWAFDKNNHLSNLTEAVLTSDDNVPVGAIIDESLNNPETPPRLIAGKYTGALEIEKALILSGDVQSEIEKTLDDPRGNYANRRAAFEKAATDIQQGTSRPIQDVITTIGGPDGKNFIFDVIETIIGPSIKEARSGTVGGTQLKTNPWMEAKIQETEKYFAERNEWRGKLKYGPSERLVELWRPQIQEGFRVYLESATVKASANAPAYFHYFLLSGSDIWRTIVGNATKKVAGDAVKKVGGKIVGGTAIKTAITGLSALVGGGIPGAILGWIGSELIGKGLSVVWGGIKGLFSFLQFGDIAKGIMGGVGAPAPPKPWYKQDSWILATICVIALLFCTGFTFIREVSTTAAIVAEKDKTGGETSDPYLNRGEPHGDPTTDTAWNAEVERARTIPRKPQVPVNFCAKNPTVEWCKPANCPTCACPVVSSTGSTPYITQGPGGSWSHANSNAIDVGLPMQSRIRSPIVGTVTESTDKYEDGSGFAGNMNGGGYGNHIVITTPQGNTLVVGHLAYGSVPAVGTSISIGQQVGRIGQTGNSTGPHLHIGFTNQGAPNIGSLFPTTNPVPANCASASQCGYLEACGAKPR